MEGEQEPRRPFAFTFGIDRLGLVALRAPWITMALVLALTLASVVGIMRLKVEDSLSELFRTDTEDFRRYEEVDRRFPSSEFDVLLVVEGKALLQREPLTAFADTIIELNLTDGLAGVVSMLSARAKPDARGYAAPILATPLPEGEEYDRALEVLRENDIVKGKFLSDDGTLALVVIALDRKVVQERGARAVIGDIQKVVDDGLASSGLAAKLTGAPVMQLEIRNAVERDRNVYNGLGFLLGTLIALAFFRSLSMTLLAVAGPFIAIFFTLGLLGALDFRLNLFINVITPLILVSAFSDSMHLVFAIRRDVRAGIAPSTAARSAVLDIAPACLLTSVSSLIVLLSFAFAHSALIRTFGLAALMAVVIAYVAVAIVVPTLAAVILTRKATPAGGSAPMRPDAAEEDGGFGILGRASAALLTQVARAPLAWSLVGAVVVVACGLAHVQLAPKYRLADQVPDKEQALAATDRLDAKLTGANPVHVMISWKGGADGQKLFEARTLGAIAAAHGVLEKEAGLGNVWSIESLRRWLAETGDTDVVTMQRYIKLLPEHLVRRFIDADETAVLVTGRLPDIDASRILPVVDKIDRALEPIRKAHPGYEIAVTGLPAISARSSSLLIGELNRGLFDNMALIFVYLAITMRMLLAGLVAILPSLFPILATGALLWLGGEGLQFASIVAITVAFSLAIDSTIHFLNRFSVEERAMPGASVVDVLTSTMRHIGPVIIVTTMVLALGLGVTVLSDLPSLRLFGRLAGVCLLASLVGQLVILPATILLYRRYWPASGAAAPRSAELPTTAKV